MKNNTNEKLTMNNETRKGKKIACLSLFTFLFSLFLFACINPFDPPRTEPAKDGVGYFALSINGGSTGDRTIQPKTVQNDFVQYQLEFFAAGTQTLIKPVWLNPDQLRENQLVDFIELPVGEYDLMVTAYLVYNPVDSTQNKAAAKGGKSAIEIVAGERSYGDIKLNAINNDGFGIFSWDIDYPEGATAEIKIDTTISSGTTAPITLTITDTPDGENQKAKKDSIELGSGTYRVTFKLVNKDDRTLEYSEILQVYQNMTSHFGAKNGGTEVFTEDYFVIKRVQKIELVTAEVETYVELPLVPKFTPPEATFRTAEWKIGRLDKTDPDPDKTGATIVDGVFCAESAKVGNSTVYVLATVEHGKGYGIDYVEQLEVTVKFVPVGGLAVTAEEHLPTETTYKLDDGTTLMLYVKVTPWNATNRDLKWEIQDWDTTPEKDRIFEIEEVKSEDPEIKAFEVEGKNPGSKQLTISSVSNTMLAGVNRTITVKPVPVEKIALSAKFIELGRNAPNNTTTLEVVVSPPNATNKNLTFRSVNFSGGNVTVNNSGLVTVVGGTVDVNAGATIYVTSNDPAYTGGEVSCNVYITSNAASVSGIELNITNMRMEEGSFAQLEAFILPKGAETDIFWTSGNSDIVSLVPAKSVDEEDPTRYNGKIEAKGPGLVEVSATTVYGGKVAKCRIEVYERDPSKPGVTGLTLSKNEIDMTAAAPHSLIPYLIIAPSGAATKLYWKSGDTNIVTVVDGVVTANPVNYGITTVTVTTEDGGHTATFTINVEYVPVDEVVLNVKALMMNTTNDVTLLVTVLPSHATNKRVTWSVTSVTDAATVDANGNVRYKGGGTATITVTSVDQPSISDECFISARSGGIAVNGIELNMNKLKLAKEGPNPNPLTVQFSPEDATEKTLYWFSSDTEVLEVDEDGNLTLVSVGEAKITVMTYDGGYIAECDIEVYAGSRITTGIRLNTDELTLTSNAPWGEIINGRRAQLIYTIMPIGTTGEIIWKSGNSAIATVVDGMVTATAGAKADTTTITAITVDGIFTASCTVTVRPEDVAVTGVRLSTNALNLEKGKSAASPIASYLIPRRLGDIKWYSVNPLVADVDENGLVSAKDVVGSTTIIATSVDGGHRFNVAVSVREVGDGIAVTGVKLNTNNHSIVASRNYPQLGPLLPFVMPWEDWQSAATNQNVYWSSPDTNLVIVDQNGWVSFGPDVNTYLPYPVDIMVTTIDGGYTETCTITTFGTNINDIPYGFTINMQYLTLNMRSYGNTQELKTGTILAIPLPNIQLNKELIWYNSNPEVATVDEDTGIVTAQKIGKTFIQVTMQRRGLTHRIEVEVVAAGDGNTPPPIRAVNSIVLDNLKIIDSGKINVTVIPANAPNRGFAWTSSNTNIATVDADGVVTGISNGATTITAISLDGGKIASCTVEVLISLGSAEMKMIPAGTYSMQGYKNVTISRPFLMGKNEITQEIWQFVMTPQQNNISPTPSYFTNNPASGETQAFRPVERVSWYDALVFCNRLSVLENLTPAYEMIPASGGTTTTSDTTQWGNVPTTFDTRWNAVTIVAGSTGYRLPTEAQWEYACRAGTTTDFYWGAGNINNYVWYTFRQYSQTETMGTAGDRTHQVGMKLPNNWGLCDMSGNVWEWCWDWQLSLTSAAVTDPTGPASGTEKIRRGGSCELFVDIRGNFTTGTSAYRGNATPQSKAVIGFRVVRPAP
jgi:uncharacterized protein YjdB/formylglycine-generating enzyme required for sulfatase activity